MKNPFIRYMEVMYLPHGVIAGIYLLCSLICTWNGIHPYQSTICLMLAWPTIIGGLMNLIYAGILIVNRINKEIDEGQEVIKTRINIARDFHPCPMGRKREDSDYSGERFREEYLLPALRNSDRVYLELDGTLGYSSAFLQEVFEPITAVLGRKIVLVTENPVLRLNCRHYLGQES